MDKVVYRVDVRIFRDSNGDGIGDLGGVRDQLGYLELMGFDAVWLTGVVAAPVAKPGQGREVDPLVGSVESFEMLTAEIHAAGMRVVLDLPARREGLDHHTTREEFATTLWFWRNHGVDGFRIGTTPGITQPVDEGTVELLELARSTAGGSPLPMLSALVWRWHESLRALDVGVDIPFCTVPFDAAMIRSAVKRVLAEAASLGVVPGWGLADWNNPRPVTRFGGGRAGLARARAMALVQLALPGAHGVDNGNELGLPEIARSDSSRNPLRSPMPWEGSQPPFGFSPAPGTWWPAPDWKSSTVEVQSEDPSSTLSLYRQALRLRKRWTAFGGEDVEWYGAPPGCLAFRRLGDGLVCALNTSETTVTLPPGEVLLASGPLDRGRLPPDTAAWLT